MMYVLMKSCESTLELVGCYTNEHNARKRFVSVFNELNAKYGDEEGNDFYNQDAEKCFDLRVADFKSVTLMLFVNENDDCVKPIPVKCCKIDGVEQDVSECTIKQWFAKINEELDELKEVVFDRTASSAVECKSLLVEKHGTKEAVAKEAMSTITAITSFLEVMGIDEEQRNEAQWRVNEKNRQRGRL